MKLGVPCARRARAFSIRVLFTTGGRTLRQEIGCNRH